MINNQKVLQAFNIVSQYCNSQSVCDECIFSNSDGQCDIDNLVGTVTMCEDCGKPIYNQLNVVKCPKCESKPRIKKEILAVFDRLDSVTSPFARESFVDMLTDHIYEHYERKVEETSDGE